VENPDQKKSGEILVDEIYPDFTTYEEENFDDLLPSDGIKDIKGKKRYSCPCSLYIEKRSEKKSAKKSAYARALACRAYSGKFWSITLRCGDEKNIREEVRDNKDWVKLQLTQYAQSIGYKGKLKDLLGYCPQGYSKYSEPTSNKKPEAEIFLNDIYQLCRKLYDILFNQRETASHPSGLIAITGATDSSKSLITRGLIFLILEAAAKKALKERQRKPHLITFEDPIEQYYVQIPSKDTPLKNTLPKTPDDLKILLDALYIDYTPREKDKDAGSLQEVTKDALRQTPAVLFVGETREKDDWKDLLQFAGSGHLVITTSHASSVVEAMSGIFRATKTETPAQRSEIARRIMGIINIRSFILAEPNIRALLPALWKNTSQSMNNLVADGLSSILPVSGREEVIGYYGRKYFANKLTVKPSEGESPMTHGMLTLKDTDIEDAVNKIRKQALGWDIKGV
jgi:hypothetical protein